MKLLTGTDHALGGHHPFQLGGHQLRALGEYGFEAGLVVGQALDAIVLGLVLRRHVVEPQRSADHLVAHAQGIQHLGGGLADGDAAGGGVLEGQGAAAVLQGQRVLSGRGLRQGTHTQACDQGGNAWQHEAISL